MSGSAASTPCLRSFAWSESIVSPAPGLDGSGALTVAAGQLPVGLAVSELLHARIHALITDNQQLQQRIQILTVALDDALDRASAHALCCDNEHLLAATAVHRAVRPLRSAQSTTAATVSAVH